MPTHTTLIVRRMQKEREGSPFSRLLFVKTGNKSGRAGERKLVLDGKRKNVNRWDRSVV